LAENRGTLFRNLLRRFFAFVAALAALVIAATASAQSERLPELGADLSTITVSGLSSGGYMAGQFHIAHSDTVKGSGIVAGGPYGCARTPGSQLNPFWFQQVLAWNLQRALNACMDDGGWLYSAVPSASALFDYASQLSLQGSIDPIDNLAAHKVYLFTSSDDETVQSGVVESAREFYRLAGVPDANIAFHESDSAAHAFITEDQGGACGTVGPPFLNDCDRDQAGEILNWLTGPLEARAKPDEAGFIHFPQAEFMADADRASMGEDGMAYIPQSCRGETGCTVHVVFHGCRQGLEQPEIGETFVRQSGYANWAEGNRMIILFPQAASSTLNPNGCWDWWGYTGADFLTKEAPQMRTVKAMLERLEHTR
jgi:acetyl esterase/lipase